MTREEAAYARVYWRYRAWASDTGVPFPMPYGGPIGWGGKVYELPKREAE